MPEVEDCFSKDELEEVIKLDSLPLDSLNSEDENLLNVCKKKKASMN